MYKALFAFAGQEGEMQLAADDLVELVEKDDNGTLRMRRLHRSLLTYLLQDGGLSRKGRRKAGRHQTILS